MEEDNIMPSEGGRQFHMQYWTVEPNLRVTKLESPYELGYGVFIGPLGTICWTTFFYLIVGLDGAESGQS